MLLEARRLLNGNEQEGDCCICGGKIDGNAIPVLKALGGSYTDFDNTIKAIGDKCCRHCQGVLKDSACRTKNILCQKSGIRTAITPDAVWELLEYPLERFVLSVPYSYKKHHWVFAGISTPGELNIGTDNRTIQYRPKEDKPIKDAIVELISMGVPKPQIISGSYHPSIAIRVGKRLDELEEIIAPHRLSGLVEFITKFAPKPESSAKKFKGDERMITKEQSNAAIYLSLIAQGSEFRATNGQQFWGGFFEHRINRVKGYPFMEATSKLMEAVGYTTTRSGGLNLFLESISEETQKEIVNTIEEQTKLCVTLAYNEIKKAGADK